MSDLVERLRSIADASRRDDGTDIPLGEYLRQAAARIEQLNQEVADKCESIVVWRAKATDLEEENALLRTLLEQAMDSLQYVQKIAPNMTGHGVRLVRIAAIETALAGKAGE